MVTIAYITVGNLVLMETALMRLQMNIHGTKNRIMAAVMVAHTTKGVMIA